jgi:hypothetical protein
MVSDGRLGDAGLSEQRVEGDEEPAGVVAFVEAERVEDGAQAVQQQHVSRSDMPRPPRPGLGVNDVERGHLAAECDEVHAVGVADVLLAQPAPKCARVQLVVNQHHPAGRFDLVAAEERLVVDECPDEVAEQGGLAGFP